MLKMFHKIYEFLLEQKVKQAKRKKIMEIHFILKVNRLLNFKQCDSPANPKKISSPPSFPAEPVILVLKTGKMWQFLGP